jgi:hypothetical protein
MDIHSPAALQPAKKPPVPIGSETTIFVLDERRITFEWPIKTLTNTWQVILT